MLPGSKLGEASHSNKIQNKMKELNRYIDERTGDMRFAAEGLIQIALGNHPKARAADQISAIGMLWDRRFGKAVDIHATLDLSKADAEAGTGLASEILETMMRQLGAAQEPATDVVDAELVDDADGTTGE